MLRRAQLRSFPPCESGELTFGRIVGVVTHAVPSNDVSAVLGFPPPLRGRDREGGALGHQICRVKSSHRQKRSLTQLFALKGAMYGERGARGHPPPHPSPARGGSRACSRQNLRHIATPSVEKPDIAA
jgi:hypothetical protein